MQAMSGYANLQGTIALWELRTMKDILQNDFCSSLKNRKFPKSRGGSWGLKQSKFFSDPFGSKKSLENRNFLPHQLTVLVINNSF